MTVKIPQAVSTYTVMYMSWNIVMEWASVGPTIVGLEWTCVYACLQPLNINPAEQIPLKTNFGTCSPQTRCWYSSDYSIVQECKCLCQRGCWLWDTVYKLFFINVIITCPLYYTPTGQDSLVKVYSKQDIRAKVWSWLDGFFFYNLRCIMRYKLYSHNGHHSNSISHYYSNTIVYTLLVLMSDTLFLCPPISAAPCTHTPDWGGGEWPISQQQCHHTTQWGLGAPSGWKISNCGK